MMIYVIQSYIIVFIETVCCFLFFSSFCQKRETCKNSRKKLVLFLLSILMCLVAMLFYQQFFMKELVEIVIISFCIKYCYEETVKKIILVSIMFQGLLTCMDYLAIIIDSSVLKQTETSEPVTQMLLVILSKMMLFTVVIMLNRIYGKQRTSTIKESDWIKFSIFPLFSICTIACLISSSEFIRQVNQQNLYLVIAFGLLGTNVALFFFLMDIIRREEKIRENYLFAMDARNRMEMYEKVANQTKKQQQLSHEYKNRIVCIQALAQRKKYEELNVYLNSIYEKVKHDEDYINVNHAIINAVLNEKYYEAMNKNILFVFKLSDLSAIWLEKDDIVLLLSNLLNNAIEACENCRGQKIIKMKFELTDGQLVLVVKNSYENEIVEQDGRLISTKKEDGHGYGIKNIKRVIRKYNGNYHIIHKNGEFCFIILLFKRDL